MAETLAKLEREVYGREAFPPKERRRGTIKIGDPIDARLYLADYADRRTRKEGIHRLVHDLQTNIQSMIDALNAEIDGAWGR